ncbi:MAG: methyltransferase [Candidatus Woesearchaeota archaeon]
MSQILRYAQKVDIDAEEIRKSANEIVGTYIANDPFIDTKDMRRLKKILSKVNGANAKKHLYSSKPRIDQRLVDFLEKSIEEKEELEASCFYQQVSRVLENHGVCLDAVIDLCAGNSLNSALWLLYGYNVYAIDNKETRFSEAVRWKIDEKYPHNFHYSKKDVEETSFTDYVYEIVDKYEKRCIITAVHACGKLTDRTISIAVRYDLPFAVVPCCHNTNLEGMLAPFDQSNEHLQDQVAYFEDIRAYIDLMRINYATEQGYKVVLKALPKQVTEKNRIIIGLPKTF